MPARQDSHDKMQALMSVNLDSKASLSRRNFSAWVPAFGHSVWYGQLRLWAGQAERELWSEAFDDPMLEEKYGKNWFKKRKQIPNDWKRVLATRASGNIPVTKGRKDYVEGNEEFAEASKDILTKLDKWVRENRKVNDSVNMHCVHTTLFTLIEQANADRVQRGQSLLPHKNSVGWAYKVKELLKLKTRTVSSTEAVPPSETEMDQFKEYFRNKVAEHSVPPSLWLSHDEFNEYQYSWDKDRKHLILDDGTDRGISRSVQSARSSVSMGLVLSPVHGVVMAYILFRQITDRKLKAIHHKFGKLARVLGNVAGNMRSQTHVEFFLQEAKRRPSQQFVV